MRLPLAAHSLKSMKKYKYCLHFTSLWRISWLWTKKIQNSTENPKIQKKYQDQIEKHCYNFYHCIVLFLHTVILCYYYYCLYHVFYYSMLYLHLYFSLLFNNTKIFFKNNDIKLHHCQMSQQQHQKRKWIMSRWSLNVVKIQ